MEMTDASQPSYHNYTEYFFLFCYVVKRTQPVRKSAHLEQEAEISLGSKFDFWKAHSRSFCPKYKCYDVFWNHVKLNSNCKRKTCAINYGRNLRWLTCGSAHSWLLANTSASAKWFLAIITGYSQRTSQHVLHSKKINNYRVQYVRISMTRRIQPGTAEPKTWLGGPDRVTVPDYNASYGFICTERRTGTRSENITCDVTLLFSVVL